MMKNSSIAALAVASAIGVAAVTGGSLENRASKLFETQMRNNPNVRLNFTRKIELREGEKYPTRDFHLTNTLSRSFEVEYKGRSEREGYVHISVDGKDFEAKLGETILIDPDVGMDGLMQSLLEA